MERLLRTFWGAAILLWCIAPVLAVPPLTITDAGYYFTLVDDAGVPSLVKIDVVVDLTSGNAPVPLPPQTPEDPQPPPKADIDVATVRSVEAWAKAINDPDGSQAVAAVYGHIRGAFDDELLTESSVWSALKAATDDALLIAAPNNNWASFRSQLSALITDGRQRGTLTTQPEISRMLASVKHGLDLSADGSPMLSDSKLVQIAIKTNEVIDAQ